MGGTCRIHSRNNNIIGLTIILYTTTDKVPATKSDYAKLEERIYELENNPTLLLQEDAYIAIDQKGVSVTVENDECSIIARYTRDMELLSISQKDKCTFWLLALIFSIIVSTVSACFIGMVLTIAILLIEIVIAIIIEKTKYVITKLKEK